PAGTAPDGRAPKRDRAGVAHLSGLVRAARGSDPARRSRARPLGSAHDQADTRCRASARVRRASRLRARGARGRPRVRARRGGLTQGADRRQRGGQSRRRVRGAHRARPAEEEAREGARPGIRRDRRPGPRRPPGDSRGQEVGSRRFAPGISVKFRRRPGDPGSPDWHEALPGMAASVLYVDDDRNLCQIVAKALAGEGDSVRTCHDAAEALAIISEHVPDLMLLDLKLPRRDGLQVLSELRKSDGDMRDLPVVVLTGAPTASSAQRVNELEAVDLLTKPVSLEKLLEVVSRCVAGAKSEVPARPPAQGAIKRRGSGNLERVAFPALLHHLHGLRATGTLHLETEKKRKWIELRDGYPVAVRSNLMRETLGKHLLRTGRVSPEVLEASRREAEKSGTRHGEILVAMHALSEEQVTEALREQADEKFFEIFSWPAGTFRFQRGARIERANALGLGRSPASLILHGVHTRFPIERDDGSFSSRAA